jgi:hypothetical protein
MTNGKYKRAARMRPDQRQAAAQRRFEIRRMRQKEELVAALARLERQSPSDAIAIRQLVSKYVISTKEARAMVASLQAQQIAAEAPLLSTVPQTAIEYLEAWRQSRADLKQCFALLEAGPDLLTLLSIHANCREWSEYWSVHERTAEARKLFADAAQAGKRQFATIQARFAGKEARE